MTGTSFAFLQPLTVAGQAGGLALMLGMSCVTAPLLIVLAPFISRLRAVFTPLVSGVVVLLSGTSLIPTAFYGLAASVRPGAPPWLGLVIGLIVIAVIVAAQVTGRAWAASPEPRAESWRDALSADSSAGSTRPSPARAAGSRPRTCFRTASRSSGNSCAVRVHLPRVDVGGDR